MRTREKWNSSSESTVEECVLESIRFGVVRFLPERQNCCWQSAEEDFLSKEDEDGHPNHVAWKILSH